MKLIEDIFEAHGMTGIFIVFLCGLIFLLVKLLDKRYTNPSKDASTADEGLRLLDEQRFTDLGNRMESLVAMNTQQIATQQEHTKSVSDLVTELRVGFGARPDHDWIGEYVQKKNAEILADCKESIQSHIKDHLLEFDHKEK